MKFEGGWAELRPKVCFHDNPGQNISNKIEKSRKTVQVNKSLRSTFACFWTAISGRETLSKSGIFLIFPESFVGRSATHEATRMLGLYTRYHVSFYLWLIGSLLKHC